MRIENSIRRPNQQAFNGYVGRNCKNAVNHAVKVLAKADLATANAQGTMLDVNTIKSYQNLGKNIIEKLNKGMEKFHPNTKLDMDISFQELKFQNTKIGECLDVVYLPEREPGEFLSNYAVAAAQKCDDYHWWSIAKDYLDNFNEFANDLINKFNPEMIDKKLFNNLKDRRYKSVEEGCFLDRAFAYRDAKKLVKIAPEFHVNPDGILYGMKKRIVNNRKAEEKHKILLKKSRIADKAEQRAQAEKRSQNPPQIDLNNKIFRTMFGK